MAESVCVENLMRESGVVFGTSGARGLAEAMTDRVCYTYTYAFLRHLEQTGQIFRAGGSVAIGGDLRPSTGRIMCAAARAASDLGYQPLNCGRIPSPALALYGLQNKIPSVMVTGSHIPEDRNGIKYNTPGGEILKSDEAGIRAQTVAVPPIFDEAGALREAYALGEESVAAAQAYLHRWLDVFPADYLTGLTIGLYQHSAVGRDLLVDIYSGLGARVTAFGRSDKFIPVDTEAVRPQDTDIALAFARANPVAAIVSTDGDSDRPLISDESGNWLRGDVAGILTAQELQVDSVVVPVSCNTAVSLCGKFTTVSRSRIGSPFVIAGMQQEVQKGVSAVAGYEANGGFLTATPLPVMGKLLPPLPTRDPVIVHLMILGATKKYGLHISQLVSQLPPRITASDRIQNFPSEVSTGKLAALAAGGTQAIEKAFPEMGAVGSIDLTDGLRLVFCSGDILHFRPSGNAPELRCYAEAATQERVGELLRIGIHFLNSWR